jgi:CO/xanthine dehydrogenase Mo-binding subunit
VGTSTSGVLLNDDGSLSVVTGSVDITGAHTALLQIAADEMEVQPERVHIRLADTDAVPYHDPSGGSRTVYAGGLAVRDAARELKRRMVETAARELEIAVDRLVYRQGSVVDRDGKDHRLSLAELGALTPHSGPLAGTATVANRPTPSAYTICIVELAVDVGTGKVRLDRVFSALEAGRAINPTLVEGQIQGAVLQGIAMALWEEYVFGPDGRVLNPNLLDYRTGTSMDVPPIETLILEYGNSEGPFDAKGVGEPPIIPPAAAVANAVRDALGRRLTHLPLTPERILLGKE